MKKVSFNQDWKFCTQNSDKIGNIPEGIIVDLPHDFSWDKRSMDAISGADSGFFNGGHATYYKTFAYTSEMKSKRVMLEFEGVMQYADVYVNGTKTLSHNNGYTSFVVDITDYLTHDNKNVVKVDVTNPELNSTHYTGSGMIRSVNMLIGGSQRIPAYGIKVVTPECFSDKSKIIVYTEVINETISPKTLSLRTVIYNSRGKKVTAKVKKVKVKARTAAIVPTTINIKRCQLWSFDSPYVYKAACELFAPDNMETPLDTAETSFGLRSIEFISGQGFKLNGTKVVLKGADIGSDLGLMGGASNAEAEEHKIAELKKAGFNAVRTVGSPPSASFLDACDRLGLMVVLDIFNVWNIGKRPMDEHLFFELKYAADIEAVIKKDRNHPSVIMWNLGNEPIEIDGREGGAQTAKALHTLARKIDSTRPTIAAAGEVLPRGKELDKLLSDKTFKSDPRSELEKVSEYSRQHNLFAAAFTTLKTFDLTGYSGALDYRIEGDLAENPDLMLIAFNNDSDAADLFKKAEENPNFLGAFSPAMDYLGDCKSEFPARTAGSGEIDIIGGRSPLSYYRSIVWGEKTSMITTVNPDNGKYERLWNYPRHIGQNLKVTVFSAGDVVALYRDGELITRRMAGKENKYRADFECEYHPGTLEAVSFYKGEELCRDTLVTAGVPKAIELKTDKKTLIGAVGTLVFIDISIVDRDKNLTTFADREVTIEIEGVAELVAFGSGAVSSHDSLRSNRASVEGGKLQAILSLSGDAGRVEIVCTSENLKKGKLILNIK